jgi:hypothetical protein
MVIPNYMYLKLKMSGPKGIITVGPSFEHAFKCDVKCVEHTEALALDEALVADLISRPTRPSAPPTIMSEASRLQSTPRSYPSTPASLRARR